jgi:hypothetical protein
MNVPFAGGCTCGAIRYECNVEPVMAFNCHCRDCQRFSGSAYSSGFLVPLAGLRFTAGEPKYHAATADSGNAVARGFCTECGAPVVATQAALPLYVVYAASLDDPSGHAPTMDIFTASAQPWDHMNPDLPKFPRGLD